MEIGPILRAMRRNRVKVGLLVAEIAFTTAIVLNCLAMIRDQRARMERPSGLDEASLLTVSIDPWGDALRDPENIGAQVEADLAALRALPEVENAAIVSPTPLQGGGSSGTFKAPGAKDSDQVRAPVYRIDENGLATMGLRIVEGRALETRDRPVTSGSQILNCLVTRDFADAAYPGVSPIGKLIESGDPEFPDVIVGVVERMVTPYGGGPMESRSVFYPARLPATSFQSYMVRAKPGDLDAAFRAVEAKLIAIQSERTVGVQTLVQVKGGGYALNAFLARVLSAIMLLLLAVTALGIFGATSISVTQRTKQIGTRRALGASEGAILLHFLLENTLIAAIGIGLGVLGAVALNVLLVTRFGGGKLGIVAAGAGVFLLWAVGVVATVFPAYRAARLSPAIATRTV